MTTVLLSGVGALGGAALEFLARSPEIDRVVTLKRSPWNGVSDVVLAMLGATLQGYDTNFEHHQVDLGDTDHLARVLSAVRPEVIVHSATVQTPRILMEAGVDDATRQRLRSAKFGMWLPWHLLPAADLQRGIDSAGIDTLVVNATFPDAVNVAIWNHFGRGPIAGAGNVEVCAARVTRHVMQMTGVPMESVEVSLVGSHALLVYGPVVPHHLRITVDGDDFTNSYDLEEGLMRWPEPIDWGRISNFALFAASAVKNALALVAEHPIRTHVTSPNGLPGGYPARIGPEGVELDLPTTTDPDSARALNEAALVWDGISSVEQDGTVRYTDEAAAAMASLGYPYIEVTFDELEARSRQLKVLFQDAIKETSHSHLHS